MGGDDFQKRGSGLGLRDAISNKRQEHEEAASERARELFDEMGVIKAVTAAIEQGKSEVNIQFSPKLQLTAPTDLYLGEITWGDVIERLCSLVRAEEVEITTEYMARRGGCC
jgi:hypothetical protein